LSGAMRSRGAHEHWSANGRRVYSHGTRHGHHLIFSIDLDGKTSRTDVGPEDYGMSIHAAPAQDETFVVGDGFNFCKADKDIVAGLGTPGDGDNPWSWDGLHHASPGETIWQYELPDCPFQIDDGVLEDAAVFNDYLIAHPEPRIKTSPVCKFRSMSKMTLEHIRLESNAHVTTDSRWIVFQSASDAGLYEAWAGRVKR